MTKRAGAGRSRLPSQTLDRTTHLADRVAKLDVQSVVAGAITDAFSNSKPEKGADAQALTAVSRVHADLNRIGGLLKLAIREGVCDRSSYYGLNVELRDAIRQVCRAVERLAGQP